MSLLNTPFRDKPPPPPPPPGCLEGVRLLNSPLSTHPFETTGGGLSRKGVPVPRSHPRPRTPPIRDKPLILG